MSSDKTGKYLSPEDRDDSTIIPDRSQIHREAVRDDLDTSIRQDVIRQQGYAEQPQQPIYGTERATPESSLAAQQGSSRQPSYHQDSQKQNYQRPTYYQPEATDRGQSGHDSRSHAHQREETRRHNERLDSVRFDGDIDLDREKKRDQLGFRDGQQYSTAERYSHINDVEKKRDPESVKYGTVEKESSDQQSVGGAAGAATMAGAAGVFKTEDRTAFASSIKASIVDSLKDDIHATEAAAFSDRAWGKKDGEEKGLLKTAAAVIGREVEAAIGHGGKDGDIDDRAKGQAQKFGYKAGKFTVLGGLAVGRGTFRLGRYGKKLSNDVSKGFLSAGEAKKLFSDRAKLSITGSGKTVGNIIKAGTLHALEDFKGSDDLGMQAITKPKDAVVKINRLGKTVRATGRTFSKSIKTSKKLAKKVTEGGKAIFALGKKLFSNPVVLKGIGIAALAVVVVALVVSVISAITSVFPALSLKSEDYELSQTYLYITELDARMKDDIINEDTRLHIPPIDEYRYYVNGVEVSKSSIDVYTNADLILTYLDSKYEDYTFSGFISGLFGTNVKDEVKAIHEQLHEVEKVRWTEEIEHESTSTDPVTGETTTDTWTEYVYHMDIYLTTQSWEDYYEANKDTLLTPDQQQQYEALTEVGVYTFRQELSSPFKGIDWSVYVTSRWGWRIHPISGELKQHLGLDIAMAGGTPINACNTGTVQVGYDADGWGNYVKVVMDNGDFTLYGHMSSVSVSSGQQIKAGDIVGYVGTTGASTGNHLHLEYHKDGKNLNPLIFTECEKSEP